MKTIPKYGQPDTNEPAKYASNRGWYKDHNSHWKFREWPVDDVPPFANDYGFPSGLFLPRWMRSRSRESGYAHP